MTRQQRAKQFQPFDAMKGLSKALKKRELKRLQENKKEINEDRAEKISLVLVKVKKGTKLCLEYYNNFSSVVKTGTVNLINNTYKFIEIDNEKIYFEDIYDMQILF